MTQNERTTTLTVLVLVAVVALWVWDRQAQYEKYAAGMARWCPHWETVPAMCEP